MRFRCNRVLVSLAVLLSAGAAVHAAPTIGPAAPVLQDAAGGCVEQAAPCEEVFCFDHAALAEIGHEMLRPRGEGAAVGWEAGANGVQSLPAVPGALLMGVVGFLTVTAVRDVRRWKSIVAGAVVLGLWGVRRLPELTARLAPARRLSQSAAVCVRIRRQEGLRFVSCLPDRRYVGLLHRLAGAPAGEAGAYNMNWAWTRVATVRAQAGAVAVLSRGGIHDWCDCLAGQAGQFFHARNA